MTLSYHLGYLETILVRSTRRQSFAGKTDSTFYNIWDLVISGEIIFSIRALKIGSEGDKIENMIPPDHVLY